MNRWLTSRFTILKWLMNKREFMYVDNVLFLKCNKCWRRKSNECFDRWKLYKFWVRGTCKMCLKEYSHNRYNNKRDEIANQNKEYYRHNKDKINLHKKEYRKRKDVQKIYREKLTNDLWYNWHTFHVRASDYVNKYWLKPKVCSICGGKWTIEMHHPSYEKFENWSDVVFCCRSCHRQIHSGRISCPSPISLFELTK